MVAAAGAPPTVGSRAQIAVYWSMGALLSRRRATACLCASRCNCSHIGWAWQPVVLAMPVCMRHICRNAVCHSRQRQVYSRLQIESAVETIGSTSMGLHRSMCATYTCWTESSWMGSGHTACMHGSSQLHCQVLGVPLYTTSTAPATRPPAACLGASEWTMLLFEGGARGAHPSSR
jgi:hypothetical protein